MSPIPVFSARFDLFFPSERARPWSLLFGPRLALIGSPLGWSLKKNVETCYFPARLPSFPAVSEVLWTLGTPRVGSAFLNKGCLSGHRDPAPAPSQRSCDVHFYLRVGVPPSPSCPCSPPPF